MECPVPPFTAATFPVTEVAELAFPISAPLKVVADSSPVSGIKLNLVLATRGARGPEFAGTKVGNMVAGASTSSVIRIFTVFCASTEELEFPMTSPVRSPLKPLAVNTPVAGI
jgi:hypothetical protein